MQVRTRKREIWDFRAMHQTVNMHADVCIETSCMKAGLDLTDTVRLSSSASVGHSPTESSRTGPPAVRGPTDRSDGFERVRKLWSVRIRSVRCEPRTDQPAVRRGCSQRKKAELNQTSFCSSDRSLYN
jgi:hypothetical protein